MNNRIEHLVNGDFRVVPENEELIMVSDEKVVDRVLEKAS